MAGGGLNESAFSGADVRQVGLLELRAERAEVQKIRGVAGEVVVRREVRTRTEMVEVELMTEVLVIETRSGGPTVMVDNVQLEPDAVHEIMLYSEGVEFIKKPFITEEVRIGKRSVTERQQLSVDLAYEELIVDESGVGVTRKS